MEDQNDGTCVGEAMTICRCLEELHPEPPLTGIDAQDRAMLYATELGR